MMNIAVFADIHGRLLLAFKLCARWQRETGQRIDLILQAGDLGAFPDMARLDKATIRYASHDPTELGFMQDFCTYDPAIAAVLDELTCDMLFVRGNHEDHVWLDSLEQQSQDPIFPVDIYRRVYNLRSGMPYTFSAGDEHITILGIGRIGPHEGEELPEQDRYIQAYEKERLARLPTLNPPAIDVLLTHHSRPDFVILERGVKIKASSGMPEIAHILDTYKPSYHFYGHYGGPPQVRTDTNDMTLSVKLADLHWERGGIMLEAGSMGLLRWHNFDRHTFEVVEAPWLREYNSSTWKYL